MTTFGRWALFVLAMLPASCLAQAPARVGERVEKVKFTDIRYLPRTLDDLGKKKAYVLVFTNTSCPLVRRYLPVLQTMARDYASKDVQFIGVNCAEDDSIISMATQARQHDVEFPFVKDFGAAAAKRLGIRRTPEVVIIDADKVLRYRGRIDDQYRLSGVRKEATRHDLKEALDAILAGRRIAIAETEVDGCPITFPKERKIPDVTFAEQVAPILQKHCWQCHHTGGSAPFALTTFKQASARAEAIAEVVSVGRMPPWFASHEFGPFVNARGLADDERQTILDWVRGGAMPGDVKKTPAPPKARESKWEIDTPDMVLQTIEFKLPAKGDIPYQYALLPHIFTDDTWVQAVQIVPDNPAALHHGNLGFGDVTLRLSENNFITGYVPGGEPMNLDRGTGFLIPKGSMLLLQLHFVATGKPETCKIAVGLRFPRDVVQKRLRNIQLATRKFAIPPGASAHRVTASRVLDQDIIGVGLFSHMHLRGKDMTFIAHKPQARSDTLLIIPNYSFSWQVPYRWEPGKMRLAKGTRLECVAHFDNSAFNPYNPDSAVTVRYGLQTDEEMMFGFFFYTNADEKLGITVDPKTGVARKVEVKGQGSGVRNQEPDVSKAIGDIVTATSYRFSMQTNAGAALATYQKDAPLHVVADKIEFFRHGDVLVYKDAGRWQRTRTGTLSDPLRILGPSAKVRAVRLPHDDLSIVSKMLSNLKQADRIVSGEFDAVAAKKLAPIEDRDLARGGTAKFWLDADGRLVKYEIAIRVQGRRGNADVDGVITRTVALFDIGKARALVPKEAKAALDSK